MRSRRMGWVADKDGKTKICSLSGVEKYHYSFWGGLPWSHQQLKELWDIEGLGISKRNWSEKIMYHFINIKDIINSTVTENFPCGLDTYYKYMPHARHENQINVWSFHCLTNTTIN